MDSHILNNDKQSSQDDPFFNYFLSFVGVTRIEKAASEAEVAYKEAKVASEKAKVADEALKIFIEIFVAIFTKEAGLTPKSEEFCKAFDAAEAASNANIAAQEKYKVADEALKGAIKEFHSDLFAAQGKYKVAHKVLIQATQRVSL
jgi:hypothetical protein